MTHSEGVLGLNPQASWGQRTVSAYRKLMDINKLNIHFILTPTFKNMALNKPEEKGHGYLFQPSCIDLFFILFDSPNIVCKSSED